MRTHPWSWLTLLTLLPAGAQSQGEPPVSKDPAQLEPPPVPATLEQEEPEPKDESMPADFQPQEPSEEPAPLEQEALEPASEPEPSEPAPEAPSPPPAAQSVQPPAMPAMPVSHAAARPPVYHQPLTLEQQAVVEAMLARSRALGDARFTVPLSLWQALQTEVASTQVPVPVILEEGFYTLELPANRRPRLLVRLTLRVLQPRAGKPLRLLPQSLPWEDVRLNGKVISLGKESGWISYLPEKQGIFVLTARASLPELPLTGGKVDLPVPRSVRTLLRLDTPGSWALSLSDPTPVLTAEPGRQGVQELVLPPQDRLLMTLQPPPPVHARPLRLALEGDVAWNLDSDVQQVVADLYLRVVSGETETLLLSVPPEAERLLVEGPEVREFRREGSRVTVFVRGKLKEQLSLKVSYELKNPSGARRVLALPSVEAAHWAGGSLLIANAMGGAELLPEGVSGLKPVAPESLSARARGLVPGSPTLAFEIAERQFSAELEVLDLGAFALRESIADTAHYELNLQPDGTQLVRARYELRNRAQQYLTVTLPPGALPMTARVNEVVQPFMPVPDAPDAYRLPLIRSMASVRGLISFPVEVTYLARGPALQKKGELALPLPRVDLPIAYAWCDAFVPDSLEGKEWAGTLRQVEKLSRETATESLGYGVGEAAGPRRETDTLGRTAEAGSKARGGLIKTKSVSRGAKRGQAPAEAEKAAGGDARAERKDRAQAGPKPEERPSRSARRASRDEVLEVVEVMPIVDQGSTTTGLIYSPRVNEQRSFVPLPRRNQAPPKVDKVAVAKRAPAAAQPSEVASPQVPALPEPTPIPDRDADGLVDAVDMVPELPSAPPPPPPVVSSRATQGSLARNYYRAGKELYERGDLTGAEENLKRALEVGQGAAATEEENATRLLDNISLARGQLKVEGKAEKAASVQVQRELSVANQALAESQRTELEAGLEASRAGRLEEARARLSKARELNARLAQQGSSGEELRDQTVQTEDALAQLEQAEAMKARALKDTLSDLKAQGRAAEALETAQKLQALGNLDEDEREALDKEVSTLTVTAVADVAKAGDSSGVGRGLSGEFLSSVPTGRSSSGKKKADSDDRTRGYTRSAAAPLDGTAEGGKYGAGIAGAGRGGGGAASGSSASVPTSVGKPPEKAESGYGRRTEISFEGGEAVEGELRAPDPGLRENRRATGDRGGGPGAQGGVVGGVLGGVMMAPEDGRANMPAHAPTPMPIQAPSGEPETGVRQASPPQDEFSPVSTVSEGLIADGKLKEGADTGEVSEQQAASVREEAAAHGAGGGGQERSSRQKIRFSEELIRGRIVATPGVRLQPVPDPTPESTVEPEPGLEDGLWDVRALVGAQEAERARLEAVLRAVLKDDPALESLKVELGQVRLTADLEVLDRVALAISSLGAARGPQVDRALASASLRRALNIKEEWREPVARSPEALGSDPRMQAFLARNHGQPLPGAEAFDARLEAEAPGTTAGERPEAEAEEALAFQRQQVLTSLSQNLEQKVDFDYFTLGVDRQSLAAFGIQFQADGGGLSHAVVDEATLNTVLEAYARTAGVSMGGRGRRELAVGTGVGLGDALLPVVLARAGKDAHSLVLMSKSIHLPVMQYLLIGHHRQVLVVKAGPQQHWLEAGPPVRFARVSQGVEVPRAGKLVRFEKTLVEPRDDLTVRTPYVWKGNAR